MAAQHTLNADFAAFVEEARPSLTRTAWLLTGNADAAADLVQSALVKLYPVWPRLDTARALAYARRTLANENIDRWRRHRGETPVAEVFDRPAAGSLEDAVAERDRIIRMLDTLPPRQRTVLVLRYFDDLSDAQVADALGTSVQAVRSAAHRGMVALREHYASPAPQGDRS